jgi:hypothetical protein
MLLKIGGGSGRGHQGQIPGSERPGQCPLLRFREDESPGTGSSRRLAP